MDETDPSDDVEAGEARPIFAIFEGGGAKGVAHVGALHAIQDNRLDIIGAAGTSAGALIAVMAAIGLEAIDIMSPDEPAANILTQNGETPTSLLGVTKWKHFQKLGKHAYWMFLPGLVGGFLASFVAAPRATVTAVRVYRDLGHFSTEAIRAFINLVIRNRLSVINRDGQLGREIPKDVTFRDLAADWPTVVPLKIVVTDVDNGALEILDAKRTPDVVVAEAVAASIAIPLVFKPAAIPSFRPGRFADGGLVSNLPIWSFSEEKLGYEREHFSKPPVPIVGFTLAGTSDADLDPAKGGFPVYLRSLIYAALQGSQGAAHSFLDDVHLVKLETCLGMLEFDRTWEAYRHAREEGRTRANDRLRFTLEVKPDRVRKELEKLRDETLVMINERRKAAKKGPVDQIRINLIRPYGLRSLRVMESLHMEADADDRLVLDRRGRGAAEVFRDRGLRVFRLGTPYEDREREFMTKYERALVRTTVKAVICVPIFADLNAWDLEEQDRPEPSGILAIDSDEPLASEFKDPDLMNMLVAQSAILYAAVSAETENG
jgi:NTE family protein